MHGGRGRILQEDEDSMDGQHAALVQHLFNTSGPGRPGSGGRLTWLCAIRNLRLARHRALFATSDLLISNVLSTCRLGISRVDQVRDRCAM